VTPDAIVVGSGPGGVNAAAALVAAGRRVVMLDYGQADERYAPLIPRRPFSELRRSDPDQHRYLLGDDFEGIALGDVRVGAQLTPPRAHVFAPPALNPAVSDDFQGSSSLARGGFGAAWSAGVFPFSDEELAPMGLGLEDLRPHFDAVAERIGVSGECDDLERFFVVSPSMMSGLELDSNADRICERYRRRRERLMREGFFLGRTRLAVCTREHRGRDPEEYLDLSYWADAGRSVYRPQWTLAELEREPAFRYLGHRHVQRFEESGRTVRVHARHADSGASEVHEAGALVLAAGTLGTAPIVLRSLGRYDVPVPILCNPYSYAPMLHWAGLGRPVSDRRHSLAQLTVMMWAADGSGRIVQAQVFSYRSLLTFKLLKESPLAYPESLRIMRTLMPHFAILGVHHEDRPTPRKVGRLERESEPGSGCGTGRFRIEYRPDEDETRHQHEDERKLLRVFRRLGCLPLRMIRPGHGANIHYAGAFPMLPAGGDLTCDRSGRLRATRSVYLADGSVFPWIPAKGLTFTLMACADRVGSLLAKALR